MKEDIETGLAGILAVVLGICMWAVGCIVFGLIAKLMWIPISFGWSLI